MESGGAAGPAGTPTPAASPAEGLGDEADEASLFSVSAGGALRQGVPAAGWQEAAHRW